MVIGKSAILVEVSSLQLSSDITIEPFMKGNVLDGTSYRRQSVGAGGHVSTPKLSTFCALVGVGINSTQPPVHCKK